MADRWQGGWCATVMTSLRHSWDLSYVYVETWLKKKLRRDKLTMEILTVLTVQYNFQWDGILIMSL